MGLFADHTYGRQGGGGGVRVSPEINISPWAYKSNGEYYLVIHSSQVDHIELYAETVLFEAITDAYFLAGYRRIKMQIIKEH